MTLAIALAGLPLALEAASLEIDIEGVGGAVEANVRASLSIVQAQARELEAGEIRRLHARAPQEIELALQPFGHYRPVVEAELLQEPSGFRARYRIDPGPLLPVSRVSVTVSGPGADDPAYRELVTSFPLAEGAPLSHADYELGKQSFTREAVSSGYFDAAFGRHEVRVDRAAYEAAVVLEFATGPRYRFGEVHFDQDVLDPQRLRGYVTFARGDPFRIEPLLKLQAALGNSPYFQSVEVEPLREQTHELEVPIQVRLVPRPAHKWLLGAGYGTDTGARGSLGLELRRVNRHGHQGEGELRLSEIEKSFSGQYLIPAAYPGTVVWSFSGGFADLDPTSSQSSTYLVGAARAGSRGPWRESVGLGFQRASFTVGSDSGVAELLTPQASWTWVAADDRIFTHRGQRVRFLIRGAHDSLASSATFLQAEAQAELVRPLGAQSRLLLRGQAGYTRTSEFRALPPAVRYFAGGDRSVRGYAYQALGPRDQAGNVIGGRGLVLGSVELDSLFIKKWGRWGAAVFYDVGNALDSFSEPLEMGAGVGLRWLSPVGLVRVDGAWALTEPGRPFRLHLTVGPDL